MSLWGTTFITGMVLATPVAGKNLLLSGCGATALSPTLLT